MTADHPHIQIQSKLIGCEGVFEFSAGGAVCHSQWTAYSALAMSVQCGKCFQSLV